MRPRYRLARSARRNLQQISDYWVSEGGEEVALRVIGGILETIITLADHSRAGVAVEQYGAGAEVPGRNVHDLLPPRSLRQNRNPPRVSRGAGSREGVAG